MKIGFIGAGNIATAVLTGLIAGGADKASLYAFDTNTERMFAMQEMGVQTLDSAKMLCESVDTVVLAVKPKFMYDLMATIQDSVRETDVVSFAVGFTQAMLEKALPDARGIGHAMPNTPTQVGEGVIALNDNHTIAPERFEALKALFSLCSLTVVVPESMFDAVTGIAGSGPAYVYMFAEAFADAGVRLGLPRQLAYQLSAQTLLGSGKMVLETGEHPGALKDAVTSPGGTTIEAVYALEKAGMRAAVMDAVDACARKIAQMAPVQHQEAKS